MSTPLEENLLAARAIMPSGEHDIDTLRAILRGERGTIPQRAALQRILLQNRPRKNPTIKLLVSLGHAPVARNHSYAQEARDQRTNDTLT